MSADRSEWLSARWRRGETTLGAWISLPSGFSGEIAARSGFDYVCADLQHGLGDLATVLPVLQGAALGGAVPVVRVPQNQSWMINKALDLGARGVIVPMINSAQEAADAVAAFRYPPAGRRSFGPTRAALSGGGSDLETLSAPACVLMVETVEGLAEVDAIAATPGVDALYVGPADLSLALGGGPGAQERVASFEDAVAAVLAACRRAGVAAGMHCHDGRDAALRRRQGFQMVTVTSDVTTLRTGWARVLHEATADDA